MHFTSTRVRASASEYTPYAYNDGIMTMIISLACAYSDNIITTTYIYKYNNIIVFNQYGIDACPLIDRFCHFYLTIFNIAELHHLGPGALPVRDHF